MNLKNYHHLADLFGKLNSQEKLEDEFTSVPGGEKLKFFWENCTSEPLDTSFLKSKIQQKLKKDAAKRRRNYILVTSASIAASILVCISTMYFLNQNADTKLDFQSMAKAMDSQSVDEVTLITSEKQLDLDEDAFIQYSKEGKVAVNSQELEEGKAESKEEEYNQLLVPAGKRARIELSDGTLLTVNSQSKVIYPRSFKGDIRKIYAQGEVYLEVAHDKQHPFIVESDDFNLRVLGTKFNISNYKGLGSTNIVLVEGSVEVTDKNEKKAKLTPNQLLNISGGSIAYQKHVDVSSYISWVEGYLILNGYNLSQITRRLSIYYGVSIECAPTVSNEKVYGKLDLKDDLDGVLECIQQTLPVKIERSDTSITLK